MVGYTDGVLPASFALVWRVLGFARDLYGPPAIEFASMECDGMGCDMESPLPGSAEM